MLFTGDILFIGGHPILWEGPASNWIAACERILGMDVETIVPGHGPITDKRGVERVKEYLEVLSAEATKRFEAGMDPVAAVRDLSLEGFATWKDPERLAINVDTLYREFRGETRRTDIVELFARMAVLAGAATAE